MEQKTKIHAEDGQQDLVITREFDLPVELVYKAHTEAEIVEQWMGTKVLEFQMKKHGCYHFETTDPKGNKYNFHGTIHDCIPNKKIIRTFEFVSAPMGIQFEFIEFEKLTEDTSQIKMHLIFESEQHRAKQLAMPFAFGLNMAHDRIQELMAKLK